MQDHIGTVSFPLNKYLTPELLTDITSGASVVAMVNEKVPDTVGGVLSLQMIYTSLQ